MFILNLKYLIWKIENVGDFYKEGTKKYLLNKDQTSLLKNERQIINIIIFLIL